MNPGGSSAKRPAAATVMHEEIHAQDTGKKIVKERENANYKFLQLIYKSWLIMRLIQNMQMK